jgi:hypothetical protein
LTSLIVFSLSFSVVCKPKILPPVVIGDARIVGKIVAGEVIFQPSEDAKGNYFIINRAFTVRFYRALWDLELARKEIERLRKIIEKK